MKSQAYNIVFPKELMDKVDTAAKRAYKNRSAYIREAIVLRLRKEEEEWDEIFAKGREIGKKMGIKSEQDVYDMMYEFRHGRKSSKSRT